MWRHHTNHHGGLRRRRIQAQVISLAAVCSAVAALTSCSNEDSGQDDKSSKPPTKSASAAPAEPSKSSDPNAADKKAVLDAYEAMWVEQARAYQQGTSKGTKLKKYATLDALARAESDLMGMRDRGVVAKGQPSSDASVTRIDMTREVPRADVKDCLDTAKWTRVYRESGKNVPLPDAQLKRYETTVKAEKWGKKWMILRVTPHQRAC
ncbi:hypothetical protein DSC45_34160 [Streptomyces sp. YIM 130001]|uniref:hypothetical protein n=1 Tax=Streptomyces sp. YIM 130001 TaxID=2259644 RepID=UPI000E6485BF|nr:hypothetical protein [Streptomyces sp. YIM 130001]RII07961.1 hypothetical protein DSC45_34160 [Streptomyces sp. YIM 130001]